jgi:raffinose/stachyose/melibiose transport system substrate-binding protein
VVLLGATALVGCSSSTKALSTASTSAPASTTATSPTTSAATTASPASSSSAVSTPASSGPAVSSPAGATGASVSFTLSTQDPDLKTQDPEIYDVVQAFEAQNPNVHINLEGQTVDQHEQKMQIGAQTNTLPDVFFVLNSLAQQMQQQGKLLDLGPILSGNGLASKFTPNLLSPYKQNNVQYGLPQGTLVTGFFYNKAIFQKYGVALPKTFDDLLAATKVFHAHGVTTIAQGANQSDFSVWAFLTMLDRFGFEQKQAGLLSGSTSYANPDFTRLYQNLQQLQKAGAFPTNITTQTYAQAVQSFIDGKSAMVNTGVWDSGKIDQSSIASSVGFWAGPTFSDGVGNQQLIMDVASAPWVVSAAVKNNAAKYDAVAKFLQFYYSDAAGAIFAQNGDVPPTTYVPQVSANEPAFAAVFAALHQPGWTSPSNQPDLVVSPAAQSAMDTSLISIMEGAQSPSAALNTVQKALHS